jgi:hypothetical protein
MTSDSINARSAGWRSYGHPVIVKLLVGLLAFSVLSLAAPRVSVAQDEGATRKLWDTAFINSGSKKTSPRKTGNRAYRIATPNVSTTGVSGETVVGVTLWRLRRASSTDSGERIIAHEGPEAAEWSPHRISANTRLLPGDRIRISIEAARTGYLYVIDREQYADGSLGEPYLIFPTTRTLGGNNQVTIGKLIEIPAQDDSPPYFTVRRTRPDHVAEVMSVIVSPTPLMNVHITEAAYKLSNALVATWETSWNAQVGFLEMDKGVGQAWTKEEKDAGAANTRALTALAPAPQLLFYRASAKPAEPVMVKVHLRYGASARRTNH